jgi:hypothetical protein
VIRTEITESDVRFNSTSRDHVQREWNQYENERTDDPWFRLVIRFIGQHWTQHYRESRKPHDDENKKRFIHLQ